MSGATQDGAGSRLRPFESALPVARCVVLFSTVSLARAAHGGVSHTTRLFTAMHRGRSDSLTERQLDRARRLRAALAAKEAARVEAINLREACADVRRVLCDGRAADATSATTATICEDWSRLEPKTCRPSGRPDRPQQQAQQSIYSSVVCGADPVLSGCRKVRNALASTRTRPEA